LPLPEREAGGGCVGTFERRVADDVDRVARHGHRSLRRAAVAAGDDKFLVVEVDCFDTHHLGAAVVEADLVEDAEE
jgi:hypothetical protein